MYLSNPIGDPGTRGRGPRRRRRPLDGHARRRARLPVAPPGEPAGGQHPPPRARRRNPHPPQDRPSKERLGTLRAQRDGDAARGRRGAALRGEGRGGGVGRSGPGPAAGSGTPGGHGAAGSGQGGRDGGGPGRGRWACRGGDRAPKQQAISSSYASQCGGEPGGPAAWSGRAPRGGRHTKRSEAGVRGSRHWGPLGPGGPVVPSHLRVGRSTPPHRRGAAAGARRRAPAFGGGRDGALVPAV